MTIPPEAVEELTRPVLEQQRRYRCALGAVGALVLLASLALNLFLAGRVSSSNDDRDIATCRAASSATLNDLRWDTVFGLIRSERRLTPAETAAQLLPIDRAKARYRRDIMESKNDPAAFLARCRQ